MSTASNEPAARRADDREPSLDEVLEGIGTRVRAFRVKNGMTLQELALKSGLSASMLSTVERGQTSPSVGTLHALAEAFGVSLNALFVREDMAQPVTRVEEQIIEITAGGVERRLALDNAEHSIELYVDDYPVGAQHALRPSHHAGYEYGVLIEGHLTVDLDDESFDLGPGDAIQYPARRGHLLRNIGDTAAKALWVNVRRL